MSLLVRSSYRLDWTPALLHLLLEELYIEDEIAELFGSTNHPTETIPQIIAVAIALRHSWQIDDFYRIIRRLKLVRVE